MMTPCGTMVRGLGARGPTPSISEHGSGYDDGVDSMVSRSMSFYWAMDREKMKVMG